MVGSLLRFVCGFAVRVQGLGLRARVYVLSLFRVAFWYLLTTALHGVRSVTCSKEQCR